MVGEADQHPTNGGSEEQAIVVMDSPEMGFDCLSTLETVPLADLREVPLTREEVREGIPLERTTSRPAKATSCQSGHSRSLLPDRLLLYSYIPPQGQAPPMEEVLAPRPESAQEIINRWNHSIGVNPRPKPLNFNASTRVLQFSNSGPNLEFIVEK